MENMKNIIQVGISCFGIQFRVLIFDLVCDKARVVSHFVAFIR